MTCPDPDDLPAALITHACGLTAASAANELICAHRDWLTNRDFTDGYITTGTHANGQAYAYIHREEVIAAIDARRLGGSGSAVSMMRIAASLADPRIPVHLACCLGNLDHTNIRLVTAAIIRPERGPNTGHAPRSEGPRPQRRGLPRIPEPTTRKHPATHELHAKGDFRHTRSPRRCADETPSPQLPRHFYSQRLLAQTRHRPPRTPRVQTETASGRPRPARPPGRRRGRAGR